MEMNFNDDLLKEKNSEILMTLGTKLSIKEAQIINNVNSWSKF